MNKAAFLYELVAVSVQAGASRCGLDNFVLQGARLFPSTTSPTVAASSKTVTVPFRQFRAPDDCKGELLEAKMQVAMKPHVQRHSVAKIPIDELLVHCEIKDVAIEGLIGGEVPACVVHDVLSRCVLEGLIHPALASVGPRGKQTFHVCPISVHPSLFAHNLAVCDMTLDEVRAADTDQAYVDEALWSTVGTRFAWGSRAFLSAGEAADTPWSLKIATLKRQIRAAGGCTHVPVGGHTVTTPLLSISLNGVTPRAVMDAFVVNPADVVHHASSNQIVEPSASLFVKSLLEAKIASGALVDTTVLRFLPEGSLRGTTSQAIAGTPPRPLLTLTRLAADQTQPTPPTLTKVPANKKLPNDTSELIARNLEVWLKKTVTFLKYDDVLKSDLYEDLLSSTMGTVYGAVMALNRELGWGRRKDTMYSLATSLSDFNKNVTSHFDAARLHGCMFDTHRRLLKTEVEYCPSATNAQVSKGREAAAPAMISSENEVRTPGLSILMGPSGSGKTRFAWYGVSSQFMKMGHLVVVYLCRDSEFLNALNPGASLLELVIDSYGEHFTSYPTTEEITSKLKSFNVHLIMDECDGLFTHKAIPNDDTEDPTQEGVVTKDALAKLPGKVDGKVVLSKWYFRTIASILKVFKGAHITIAGTMLDVDLKDVGPRNDWCLKYRLQPWTTEGFTAYIRHSVKETTACEDALVRVNSSELLSSLTTNARTATYLREALVKTGGNHSDEYIMDFVITEYIMMNSLQPLNNGQRARIGQLALQCACGLHSGGLNAPPSDIEIECIRKGLLMYNVERIDNTLQLAKGAAQRVSISRALTLVSLKMVGLIDNVAPLTEWDGVERMCALWAACMIPYAPGVLPKVHHSAVGFGSKVPPWMMLPDPGRPLWFVTGLPSGALSHTAVINRARGSHVDVMAPWVLIKAKSSSGPTAVKVQLEEELTKANLLVKSGDDFDSQFMSLLLSIWGHKGSTPGVSGLGPFAALMDHTTHTSHEATVATYGDNGKTLSLTKVTLPPPKLPNTSEHCNYLSLSTSVPDVPEGHVRFVLVLYGHAFSICIPDGSGPSLDMAYYPEGGCVRLLQTVQNGGKLAVGVCNSAFTKGDGAGEKALNDLFKTKSPTVPFVVDILFHPSKVQRAVDE